MAIDDDAVAAVNRLTETVEGLRIDVQALRRRWRWMAWAAALAAVLLLVGGLNFRYSSHQANCTRAWVNGYSARITQLVPAATQKNTALDGLIRAIVPKKDETREAQQVRFQSALTAYLAASDNYQKVSEDNPAPLAPAFTC